MTQPPDPDMTQASPAQMHQPPPMDAPPPRTEGPAGPPPAPPGGPPPQQGYGPPPQQGYGPPPQQGYGPPPQQGYGPPPQQGYLPSAPPVPAGYGYGQAGGPVVPPGMYFDQASGLMLPQGVELASSGRRIGAYFLAIPLAIVTLGIGYVIWGLVVWANGQTPALQVLGMRCWRPEDRRIAGFWWMALREIVGRIVDGIVWVITLLVSFIFMLTRPDRRTLHDLIAGTVVLYDPNKVLVAQPPPPPV
jgi:uncharacterized RDD family membrane protein YckC